MEANWYIIIFYGYILTPFFLFCCQTIITVSFNPLNSYNQYVLQWKEYHQVRLVLFWITDKVDMLQLSFDIWNTCFSQKSELYIHTLRRSIDSPMYRNGKLMAKVNTSMQMKLQEQGMEKYKAILKGWIQEQLTQLDWEC